MFRDSCTKFSQKCESPIPNWIMIYVIIKGIQYKLFIQSDITNFANKNIKHLISKKIFHSILTPILTKFPNHHGGFCSVRSCYRDIYSATNDWHFNWINIYWCFNIVLFFLFCIFYFTNNLNIIVLFILILFDCKLIITIFYLLN